jgi:hypothetical protein
MTRYTRHSVAHDGYSGRLLDQKLRTSKDGSQFWGTEWPSTNESTELTNGPRGIRSFVLPQAFVDGRAGFVNE